MWLLLIVFSLNFVAVQMLVGGKGINAHQGGDILFFFGQQLFGPWASYVMIFAVISSTVATTQTTVLPAARITLSMARDGVFPSVFAYSREVQDAAIGTIIVAFLSLFGILLTTFSSSSANVFNDLVLNIGVLVAFYYGITGIACAWAFRGTLGKGLRANLSMIVAPLLGGVALLFVCYQVIKSGGSSSLPDVIVLLSSLPALLITWLVTRNRTRFWSQPRVRYDTVED